MGKQKMTPIGIACILLVLLVVAFMVRGSLREPEKIVLPPEPSTTEPSGPIVDNEAVDRVEVRPDTVQSAIEVLARPRVYTRTITVERYWSGGSGVSVITAAAADGWLRLDVTETDGQTRHVITGDDAVYIWYGSSRKVYSGASALTQDAEQGILTYEDILALPPERIAAADYRALEGVNCIYVETEPDEAGYVERYWVSVSSGLLAAAERECDGAVVYRMAALTVSYDGVDAEDFTLPNGQAVSLDAREFDALAAFFDADGKPYRTDGAVTFRIDTPHEVVTLDGHAALRFTGYPILTGADADGTHEADFAALPMTLYIQNGELRYACGALTAE